jgi:hypothetical protein
VKVENPVALRFILQDELYLLKADKPLYEHLAVADLQPEEAIPVIQVAVPIIAQPATPPIAAPAPVATALETAPQPTTPSIAAAAPVVKTPVTRFTYTGKNLKRFLVLVHYPELEFIDDAHLSALTNIIKRKELAFEDIVIVNLAKQTSNAYTDLLIFFKPSKLLVLGANAMPSGIPTLSLNKPIQADGISALYSYSFGDMMDNVEYKKAFWEQVKGF